MFDMWLARDLDGDGDIDMVGTRGNSYPYDGVIWLEQVRTSQPRAAFEQARDSDSQHMPLPAADTEASPAPSRSSRYCASAASMSGTATRMRSNSRVMSP